MQHIYDKLDLTIQNGLHIFDEAKDVENFPQRLNRSLKEISPTSIFIFNNKPIILFFNKDIEHKEVFKQCWNFSETPIIIINNDDNLTFEIYNGFNYIKEKESLGEINANDELNYISIVSGKYFENSKNIFDSKNKVDRHLLKNIKDARDELLSKLLTKELDEKIKIINNNKKKKLATSLSLEELKEFRIQRNITNSLMGRLIFIRYLIDRNVKFSSNEIFKGNDKEAKKEEFKRILASKEETYELFEYLKSDKGFNGDWFPIISDDKNKIYEKEIVQKKHLEILQKLLNGYSFKDNQGSLFEFYDFSIIPIEFISNVYESFMGEEYQKESGAYYTPTFMVDYILKYTVDDYFKNNPAKYNCKVLDPACGSGIFLVETLRKLISQFKKLNNDKITQIQIKKLVENNIYGIDKDENAVQISIFSLYLTMLDYQTPADIAKFKFPYLLESNDNPNPNFFQNDFFDENADYNKILSKKNINFIVGNPPYGKGTIQKKSFAEGYIKKEKIKVGNRDVVQPFMIKAKSFLNKDSKVAFVITSKVFYNFQSKEFRTKHFFNNFKINHILELSAVRKEIFENADVPVSIIFYEKATHDNITNNTINYISIKPNPLFSKLKIFFIAKNDFKKVQQKKLLENDYLWKILVYGSYLDFNFIKRLKSYDKVSKHIVSKEGMMIGGGDKNSTVDYNNMPYIQTKQISQFCVKNNNDTWVEKDVHRSRTIDIFKAPFLLVSKGVGIDLNIKSGILKYDAVFTNSISSVKAKNINTLYSVMSLLHSDFFKYYMFETASSVAIEREQSLNIEKFNIPYIENKNIIKIAKEIELFLKNNLLLDEKKLNELTTKLNNNILEAFNLSEQEYTLIDYATNVMIPWTLQKNYKKVFEQLGYEDKRLWDYINIFIKHYSNIYEQNNMYFNAEVLWDKYTICINFKVLNTKPKASIIWKKDKNIQKFLNLAGNKTLENLYIQKDIKGFESDGFYILKPNEYKNWHKAIGYLDFYEIDDAILRAGK